MSESLLIGIEKGCCGSAYGFNHPRMKAAFAVFLSLISNGWGIVPFPERKSDSQYFVEDRKHQVFSHLAAPLLTGWEVFNAGLSRKVFDHMSMDGELVFANTDYDRKLGGRMGLSIYPSYCFDGWRFHLNSGLMPGLFEYGGLDNSGANAKPVTLSTSFYLAQVDLGFGYNFLFSNGVSLGFNLGALFGYRITESSSGYQEALMSKFQADYDEVIGRRFDIQWAVAVPVGYNF